MVTGTHLALTAAVAAAIAEQAVLSLTAIKVLETTQQICCLLLVCFGADWVGSGG